MKKSCNIYQGSRWTAVWLLLSKSPRSYAKVFSKKFEPYTTMDKLAATV